MEVELRFAGVPRIGALAVHYWFVTKEVGHRDRWEIWHRSDDGGESVGHLHRNLMHPDAHVGGSPMRLERHWAGDSARRIANTLQLSWETYPYRDRYRVFPGPNSNTYVAWVLRNAGIAHRLSLRGIGQGFIDRWW